MPAPGNAFLLAWVCTFYPHGKRNNQSKAFSPAPFCLKQMTEKLECQVTNASLHEEYIAVVPLSVLVNNASVFVDHVGEISFWQQWQRQSFNWNVESKKKAL